MLDALVTTMNIIVVENLIYNLLIPIHEQTWDPISWEVLIPVWEVLIINLGSIDYDPGKY